MGGIYGVDFSTARPTRAQLDRPRTFSISGVTHVVDRAHFACRYLLDEKRNRGKALSRAEALTLSSWNIDIAANFEYATGGPLLGFDQGVKDARVAMAELAEIGAPRFVVYFSMDEDISISQIPQVLSYASGASSVLGKENVGLYGEYDLMQAAGKAGYRWLWQTYAWSWGLWSPYATVRQIRNGAFPGEYDGDLNLAMTVDIGAWRIGPSVEEDMAWNDDLTVPDDLIDDYARVGITVAKGTKLSGVELAWRADLRGVEARETARKALDAAKAAQLAAEAPPAIDYERLASEIILRLPAGVPAVVDAQAIAEAVADESARRQVE